MARHTIFPFARSRRLHFGPMKLVRVKATSVNPIEWKMRAGLGLPKPIWRLLIGRPMILGIDFAGTVVAAGPEVEGYRIGDDVMGAFRFSGADTEYAVVRPGDRHTAIALKPASVSYAEAAAVSFAGLVALAGMTTHGGLATKANSRVLVIGASGGVGHLAIQIAKRGMGAAFVVGVCSSKNEEFVRKCGADDVIAYDRTPIESIASHHPEWERSFDLIFDAVGIDKAWTVLAPRLLSTAAGLLALRSRNWQMDEQARMWASSGVWRLPVGWRFAGWAVDTGSSMGLWVTFLPSGAFRRWCNGWPKERWRRSWRPRTRLTSLRTPIVQARQAERLERFPL